MEYIPYTNKELVQLLPNEWAGERKVIHAVRTGADWLECSLLTGVYPPELRAVWHQRGEEWLNLCSDLSGIELEFSSEEHLWTFTDHIDRAERAWEAYTYQ